MKVIDLLMRLHGCTGFVLISILNDGTVRFYKSTDCYEPSYNYDDYEVISVDTHYSDLIIVSKENEA